MENIRVNLVFLTHQVKANLTQGHETTLGGCPEQL